MGYPRLVEYLKQGWRFIYEPDTHFIGITHEQGGQQSLCDVALRQPLRDQIGHELASLIHNAMLPTDATHVRIEDQTLAYYKVTLPHPASGMNIKVMSKWERGEWRVQTGGPLPWDELILLVPEKTLRPEAGEREALYTYFTGTDNLWHVMLWGEDVFATKDPLQRDMFVANLKIQLHYAEKVAGRVALR